MSCNKPLLSFSARDAVLLRIACRKLCTVIPGTALVGLQGNTQADATGFYQQAVADSKKTVADEDILALLGDEANQENSLWDLLDLQVTRPPVPQTAVLPLPFRVSALSSGPLQLEACEPPCASHAQAAVRLAVSSCANFAEAHAMSSGCGALTCWCAQMVVHWTLPCLETIAVPASKPAASRSTRI